MYLLLRAPLLIPSHPAHGSFLRVPRSCAPAAGSALETRSRDPPSHHPSQRHLCHPPPMSQQPHEPDQEPTGAAQWQCQCSLYSLCKSPLLGPEGGGCGSTDLGWWGWLGKRSSLEPAGENGERAWFNNNPLPATASGAWGCPSPSPGSDWKPLFQGVQLGLGRAEGKSGKLGTAGLGIPPPRGAGGQ